MKTITYRFEVSSKFALTDDPDSPDFYTEAQAISVEHRRRLELALFALLKKFEGDCDCELMDFSVEDDGIHAGDCDCEMCRIERAQSTSEEVNRD